MPATLAISQLTLTNFRNHLDLRLNMTPDPVVLTGMNGSGKTNILEAISLLVPGRGLSRASSSDWQSHNAPSPWAVASVMDVPEGDVMIATGKDPANPLNERRIVAIDGQVVKSQQALAEHVVMSWVTPDMDRVLADGPSARRRLIDRMAYSFDPAHSGRVTRYEKAMRERLRLLRDGVSDAHWLSGLEDEMARTGVTIAAARNSLLRQLQTGIADTVGVFPRADLSLRGLAEEALGQEPALMVEDRLRDALARVRGEDAQSGTTSVGVHRTDLKVIHRGHNCPADLCSTGEQKALLIALMMAYVRTLIRVRHVTPLFLLDDITSHLDSVRRAALFEELRELKVQAWLTGTDEAPFKELLPHAQAYHLDVEQVSKVA